MSILERRLSNLCTCCQRRVQSVTTTGDGRRVCEGCQSAEHSTPQGKDRTHIWLWKRDYDTLDQAGDQIVADMRARVEHREAEMTNQVISARRDLREFREKVATDYKDELSKSLKDQVETEALRQATDEKDRAFSRESEVLSILLIDIEPLHRGKRGPLSKCTCGDLTAECSEWQAIEPLRSQLRFFEKQQLERMRAGKWFGLPRRHPEVKRSRGHEAAWVFKGLQAHVARLDRDIPNSERFGA